MPDIFTKAKRSAVMAAIRGRGNKDTELRMRALLRAHGITGWRRQGTLRVQVGTMKEEVRSGSVSVDFVFRRERVALFVDGCFWHGCPKHGTMPAGNRAFWKAKLGRNTEGGHAGDAWAAPGGLEGAAHLGARLRREALAARGRPDRAGAGGVVAEL